MNPFATLSGFDFDGPVLICHISSGSNEALLRTDWEISVRTEIISLILKYDSFLKGTKVPLEPF